MPCVMYSSTSSRVMPWAASSCAAYDLVCWSVAASTSPDCTSWRPALWTCSTAVCSTRRNASVCSGSFCCPRVNCSTDSLQVLVEIAAQLRQVGAAGGEDPLAVRVVRQRVEQVLERQVRVPARRRLAVRDREHDFESWAEHVRYVRVLPASSSCALLRLHRRRSGKPFDARAFDRPSRPWFPRPRAGRRRRGPCPACAPPS